MGKILITSGCSFSECLSDPNYLMTWPIHLHNALKPHGYSTHVSKAMGSQGNGLISRGIIYAVTEALKTYSPDDILVGVMWSGSNRRDYLCQDPDLLSFGKNNTDGWIENPTNFVEGAEKRWVIMNQHWGYPEAKTYYKIFHSYTGDVIYSIEHILRTQYFLKSKGVKYFFTNYVDNNIVDFNSQDYAEHRNEIDYLYHEIDFGNYLPVTSEHRWLINNSEWRDEYKQAHFYDGKFSDWAHPDTKLHCEFVDKVIYPYLQERKYI